MENDTQEARPLVHGAPVERPPSGWPRTHECSALIDLGRALRGSGYRFVTPTPETHRRVVARRREARDVRDIFGWSLPFRVETLPPSLRGPLQRSGAMVDAGDGSMRSRVRWSSIGDDLFVHSAYPTSDSASVFFGPDTYRFVSMLRRAVHGVVDRLVDVGCGSGAGGLSLRENAAKIVLADINPLALALAEVNSEVAGCADRVEVVHSDVLAGVVGPIDLVVSNPPYLVDDGARVYRDGGDALGSALSTRIAVESLERLRRGGRLLLYTGTAVVAGEDVFRRSLGACLEGTRSVHYEELDPDVFGEELERAAYENVERLAVVGLDVVR